MELQYTPIKISYPSGNGNPEKISYILSLSVSQKSFFHIRPAKWRDTVSGELRFMTSYLES